MERADNVLFCKGARRHTFDVASAGYVNLASSKAAGGGDDAALIQARTAFLEKECYKPIADAVCAALRAHASERLYWMPDAVKGTIPPKWHKTAMPFWGWIFPSAA